MWTDTIVESVDYDPDTQRATSVRLHNTSTGERSTQSAKIIFLCTGSVNTVSLLLRSLSDATPNGLGNSSGLLGKYFMDHAFGAFTISTIPGIDKQMYLGRKPNGVCIPRFVNLDGQDGDFLRGYSFQGYCSRSGWNRGSAMPGIGVEFKNSLRQPGGWTIGLGASVECLPRRENAITIDFNSLDTYGLPLSHIDVRWGDNEQKAAAHAVNEAVDVLTLLGGHVVVRGDQLAPAGTAIHEMGGACMGADPRDSVTNAYNQLHDSPNVFVTDGAFMSSTGDRNPSLTYMAFTARAAAFAAEEVNSGRL